MKNRLSFLTLGLLGIVSMTQGCGADEGTNGGDEGTGCTEDRECREGRLCSDTGDPDSDMDDFCEAGEVCRCVDPDDGGGGTSGSGGGGTGGSGKGGTAGAIVGGSSGTGTGGTAGTPTSALGEPCGADADCGGEPLVCLLADGLPSGDGMPNGMCTLPCTANDQCLEFADAAYCVGLEEISPTEIVRYCMLACDAGPSTAPKCRLRDDFACSILDTQPGVPETACAETSECGVGQVCFAELEGDPEICHDMITACLPTCRADSDCASGQWCNFASGFCLGSDPEGLPIGALCDPTLPAAEDPCNGLCLATDETETEGTCGAFCSAGPNVYGCGWVGDGVPDAGCLYATVISRDAAGDITLSQSDLMLCGALCDCNDDCPAEVEFCMDENSANASASIMAIFGRQGYCRPLIAERMETEANSFATCP
jgi:hypothetical protein